MQSNSIRASIVMATFNGEKYIKDQVMSIIKAISTQDEIIVSDDGSSDNTIGIVKSLLDKINHKIIEGPRNGVAQNFQNAINNAKGQYIFIADQDDIWYPNKVEECVSSFENNKRINLILHNAGYCDSNGMIIDGDIFSKKNSHHGMLRNIVFSTYYGCCMAIRTSYLNQILPLPQKALYDQYLGCCAERDRCSLFLNEKLILHRYHGENWSTERSIFGKIKTRVDLASELIHRK